MDFIPLPKFSFSNTERKPELYILFLFLVQNHRVLPDKKIQETFVSLLSGKPGDSFTCAVFMKSIGLQSHIKKIKLGGQQNIAS